MKEVNPLETNRAESYKLFIDAPMPMVTIFKTFDITNLIILKSKGYKLNMLLCYCIVNSANEIAEIRLLPVGKKMIYFDNIAVNIVVSNIQHKLNYCDIPFESNLDSFNKKYLELTEKVRTSCKNFEITDSAIIGTSSLVNHDIDGIINMYSGRFNNPFLAWGKYNTINSKTTLKLSFQFHHVQMDGEEACTFLDKLQDKINTLK